MSDNKKYYYLKLKDNFFESEELKLLESMPDGYLYSNILMKLYLKSLKNGGKVAYRDAIPYNSQMLSTLIGHQVGTIEKSLEIFKQLQLVEVLDNGTIFMLDIQNFIGSSGTEADRKRLYRKKVADESKNGTFVPQNVPEVSHDSSLEIRDKRLDIREYKEPPTPKTEEKLLAGFSLPEKTAIESWLVYKKEKRQAYRPTGLKTLMNLIKEEKLKGCDIASVINVSISNNWAGLFFDKGYGIKQNKQVSLKKCNDKDFSCGVF